MDLKTKLKIGFLIALEVIFCFTPIGSIPIGPIVATLAMVPVIIASLTFGKKIGILMGTVFAICSFIYWTFIMPAFPTAFLFTPFAQFATYKGNFGSLIICFVPRILAGFFPALISNEDVKDKKALREVIASAVGSLTNTILVFLFIIIFFRNEYADVAGKAIFAVLGTTFLTNGIPEAIICAVVCPVISNVLKKI